MKIPKTLYHYTSQEGLIGIISNKNIRMTDIYYLNDSTEFNYPINMTIDQLEKLKSGLIKKGELRAYRGQSPPSKNEKLHDLFELIIGYLTKSFLPSNRSICVFSLSEKKDDLDHWRGYCPSTNGFCIAFDTSKLLAIKKMNLAKIYKCEYNEQKQLSILRCLLENLVVDFEYDPNKKNINIASAFIDKLWLEAPFIKHKAFKKEMEWRLMGIYRFGMLKYKEGKSTIIPYYEYAIIDHRNILPITEIIIGPTPHKELSERSLNALLRACKIDYIKVVTSGVPYRAL